VDAFIHINHVKCDFKIKYELNSFIKIIGYTHIDRKWCGQLFSEETISMPKIQQKQKQSTAKKYQEQLAYASPRKHVSLNSSPGRRKALSILTETNSNTPAKAKSLKVNSNVNLLLIIRIILILLILIPRTQLYKPSPFFLPLSILLFLCSIL
jgi:hypothetical protein